MPRPQGVELRKKLTIVSANHRSKSGGGLGAPVTMRGPPGPGALGRSGMFGRWGTGAWTWSIGRLGYLLGCMGRVLAPARALPPHRQAIDTIAPKRRTRFIGSIPILQDIVLIDLLIRYIAYFPSSLTVAEHFPAAEFSLGGLDGPVTVHLPG